MAENAPWMAFGLKLDDQLADAVASKDGICPAQWALYAPKRNSECKVGGCRNPAAERNYGCCGQHRAGWWPKTAQVGADGRQVAPAEAGCAWLGPQFMRSDERRNLCDCGTARCLSIGYVAKKDLIELAPVRTQRKRREEQVSALAGLTAKQREHLRDGRKFLAHWHFQLDHQFTDAGGSKKLRDLSPDGYKDKEGKLWGGPVPDVLVTNFTAEARGRRPRAGQRWLQGGGGGVAPLSPVRGTPGPAARTPRPGGSSQARPAAFTPLSEPALQQAHRQDARLQEIEAEVDELRQDHALLQQHGFRSVAEMAATLRSLREEGEAGAAALAEAQACARAAECAEARTRAQAQEWGPIRWGTLQKPGSRWRAHIGTFTWFRSLESLEIFLDVLNQKRHAGDAGICTRLRPYGRTTRAVRRGARPPRPSGLLGVGGRDKKLIWREQYLVYAMCVPPAPMQPLPHFHGSELILCMRNLLASTPGM